MVACGVCVFVMLAQGMAVAELLPEDECSDIAVSLFQADLSIVTRLPEELHLLPGTAQAFIQQRPEDTNAGFLIPQPSSYLGYRESGGMECGLNHSSDLYKPIPDVLAEHPGVDGYCYFEFHAPWMTYVDDLVVDDYLVWGENARLFMRSNEAMCPNDPGFNNGPEVEVKYIGDDGNTITLLDLHEDCLHIGGDVKYCHALGWLGNQVDTSLMTDPEAWRALNEEECERLNQKYNFTDEEITLGKHIDDQAWIFSDDGLARNLALHGYHKCLLGHGAEEMAYCANLSCLLPDNQIGHADTCD